MIKLCSALLFLIVFTPSSTFAITPIAKSGHTLVCNTLLIKSLVKKKQAVDMMVAAGFLTSFRLYHKDLHEMSDEEFNKEISKEIWTVAACHPLASKLVGALPGKDYLSPLNTLTSVPSSVDRKVTYAVWAYDKFYRSLSKHIVEMKSNINTFPSRESIAELASAQRLLDRLRVSEPDKIAQNRAGKELEDWLSKETQNQAPQGDRGTEEEVEVTKEVLNSFQGLKDDIGLPNTGGPLRPTVPVYALIGRELFMYEVDTVHLLFPSNILSGNGCYERYAPNYPVFARLINTGKAEKVATTMLSTDESAEIMRFFNSATGIQAQGFLLSDLNAIAMHDDSSAKTLASCLNLASKTYIKKAVELTGWEYGTVASFDAEDKLWQTLISMLAVKRMQVAPQN